jgi:hypothetical protein
MNHFHFSTGNNCHVTRFGLEFDSLKSRIRRCVGDWTEEHFIPADLSKLLKDHPGDNMLAKLEETYKVTFRQYKVSVNALNRHSAAPSGDLSRNNSTQDAEVDSDT